MGGGIRADQGRSYRVIEQVADRVRAVLVPDLAAAERLPCMTLFERLDQFAIVDSLGRKTPFTYAVRTFPAEVEGLTTFEGGRIVVALSEQSYGMLEADHPRAGFALAHEVGHAALHAAELRRLAEIPHGDLGLYRKTSGEHEEYMDTEWQANSFAAALLMPAKGLARLEAQLSSLSPEVLQVHFGVSAQAAEIRLGIFRKRRSALL